MDKFTKRFLGAKFRLYFGLFLLVTCFIGWPLSALWWAKDEPQFVLGLSWMALILTSVDIINTALVSEEGK